MEAHNLEENISWQLVGNQKGHMGQKSSHSTSFYHMPKMALLIVFLLSFELEISTHMTTFGSLSKSVVPFCIGA